MAKKKQNMTREDKFRKSLDSWGEQESRPFVREKETPERDEFDYKRKHELIKKEKEEIAKVTGDKLENINIYSSRGECSQSGPIKGWTRI